MNGLATLATHIDDITLVIIVVSGAILKAFHYISTLHIKMAYSQGTQDALLRNVEHIQDIALQTHKTINTLLLHTPPPLSAAPMASSALLQPGYSLAEVATSLKSYSPDTGEKPKDAADSESTSPLSVIGFRQ